MGTAKNYIIGLLVLLLVAAGGYIYVQRGGAVHDDSATIAEIRSGFDRLEKRNSDLETKLLRIADIGERTIQEIRDSRAIVQELAGRNQRSIEALGRSEDRLAELEKLLREVREGKPNP